jgi:enoyl-CoA hydratase
MTYENILLEIRDHVAIVTLNRPKALNALNAPLLAELKDAVTNVRDGNDAGAIVITGAEKAFSAGADIGELAQQTPLSGAYHAKKGQALLRTIETLGKPVIAAINGFALGGGCELAMACTFRIASEKAKIGQPEVNLGIIPGYGGTQRLPRLVGRGMASELILSGRIIDANEALRIGLVNRVVAPEALLPTAMEIAKTIVSKGPIAVRLAMEAIDAGLGMDLDQGLNVEADLFGLACASADMKEGLTAFLEKREAKFQGR